MRCSKSKTYISIALGGDRGTFVSSIYHVTEKNRAFLFTPCRNGYTMHFNICKHSSPTPNEQFCIKIYLAGAETKITVPYPIKHIACIPYGKGDLIA